MTPLEDMTTEELDEHRREVLTEIERRETLEDIPEEIGKLKKEYTAAGGTLSDLDKGDDEK